jgi:DnaJ-class molecular chaperone
MLSSAATYDGIDPLAFIKLRPGDDPYKVLGVPREARDEDIRKSFRHLTKWYHPDAAKTQNERKENENQWIKINDAYELFKDPITRERYDRYGITGDEPVESSYGSGFQSYYESGNSFRYDEVYSENFTDITIITI